MARKLHGLLRMLTLAAATLTVGCWLMGPIAPDLTDDDDEEGWLEDDTDSDGDTDSFPPFDEDDDGSSSDPSTGLTWQQAAADFRDNRWEAQDYCEQLDHAGYDDWRLPMIQELRTLIRGCPSADCDATDPDCLDLSCGDTTACDPCPAWAGPEDEGCYLEGSLSGFCDGYWSSSPNDTLYDHAWYVDYRDALVSIEDSNHNWSIRCVRGPD